MAKIMLNFLLIVNLFNIFQLAFCENESKFQLTTKCNDLCAIKSNDKGVAEVINIIIIFFVYLHFL